MSEECECPECGDLFSCDDGSDVVYELEIDGSVRTMQRWCPHCFENDCFYCDISSYWFADNEFSSGIARVDDTCCISYVEAKGWTYNLLSKRWEPPHSKAGVSMAQALDFYWKLPKGKPEQVCMLIYEEQELQLADIDAKAIRNRTVQAGANPGDSAVLNVYSRLYLIEKKILPATYRL